MNSSVASATITSSVLSQLEKKKMCPAVPAGAKTYKNFSLPLE